MAIPILLNMGFHLMQQAEGNILSKVRYRNKTLQFSCFEHKSKHSCQWAYLNISWSCQGDHVDARSPVDTWISPCRDRLKRKVGIPPPVHWFWSVTSLFLNVWRHTLRLPWITWGVSNPIPSFLWSPRASVPGRIFSNLTLEKIGLGPRLVQSLQWRWAWAVPRALWLG